MTPVVDSYAVIGNPIAHSRSPWLHAAFAQQTQQAIRYDRCLLPTDGFAQGLSQLRDNGLMGCNVTVPFKGDAFALAQWHSPAALLAQACNTLWWDGQTLKADNTDGVGLVRDITHNAGVQLSGQRILIVGAGGAAAGIVGPLIAAGCGHIHMANRTAHKAHDIMERHQLMAGQHGCTLSAGALDALDALHVPPSQHETPAAKLSSFDVIINASAASLVGQRIALPSALVHSRTLAIDLMYGPSSRVFLDWANAQGCATRDGLGMLVEQAAQSFFIWRGVMPSTAGVLAQLRAMVDAPSD
jgi:shikimate dehydrogenase